MSGRLKSLQGKRKALKHRPGNKPSSRRQRELANRRKAVRERTHIINTRATRSKNMIEVPVAVTAS
jgi:hypothetical protein